MNTAKDAVRAARSVLPLFARDWPDVDLATAELLDRVMQEAEHPTSPTKTVNSSLLAARIAAEAYLAGHPVARAAASAVSYAARSVTIAVMRGGESCRCAELAVREAERAGKRGVRRRFEDLRAWRSGKRNPPLSCAPRVW